jgi:hypothetical protein
MSVQTVHHHLWSTSDGERLTAPAWLMGMGWRSCLFSAFMVVRNGLLAFNMG